MLCKFCNREINDSKSGVHLKSCEKTFKFKNEIFNLYLIDKLSIDKISKLLDISYERISEILGNSKREIQKTYDIEMIKSILELRNNGLTYNEINKKLNCSKATISKYCKQYNLNDFNKIKKINSDLIPEMQYFYDNGYSTRKVAKKFNVCKTTVTKYITLNKKEKTSNLELKKNKVQSVTNWKIRLKEKSVEYKGGKCEKCGYNKCINVLSFHHLDPSQKDFSIAGKCLTWDKLKNELDKCSLLCMNCHQELHSEMRKK
jgi:predicted transcriptional regulator